MTPERVTALMSQTDQRTRLKRWTGALARRRDAAAAAGDMAALAQWNAALRVMNTRIVPLACPAAVWLAGRAARAAHEGRDEKRWYRAVTSGLREEARDEIDTATVLLRAAGLWPWG